MKRVFDFLQKNKYEFLLFALIQHLYISVFLDDLDFYTKVIWPIYMLVLGLGSFPVFSGKYSWKHWFRNILFVLVLLLPIGIPFFKDVSWYFKVLNISYVLFFMTILYELMRFLLKPSYNNRDIITASICGYLLLIEISVFLLQYFMYQNPTSFKGIDMSSNASIYTDLVYFCSITFTSIGFGDITPNNHVTKLITSVVGIVGQFYAVVLVGILISKLTGNTENK